MISRDNILGAMYGLALGDAMGRPTEFMPLKNIHKTYGRAGYMALPEPALFTDDTQMSIAVARALMAARFNHPREYVRTLTNEFIRWRALDEPRAPGASCMTAVMGLMRARAAKRSWTTGTTLSLGCGANMRVTPTALLPSDDMMVGLTQLQAAITHGHARSIAASELTAWAIRWAAQGVDMNELPEMLYHKARAQVGQYHERWLGPLAHRWAYSADAGMTAAWSHMASVTRRVSAALALRKTPVDICGVLGGAWVAGEAYATSLYFAVKYANDPAMTISMAARTNGDSDSIACLAGAIVGARHGENAWPLDWRVRIERRHHLIAVADYLWGLYN